jgi:alpha-tubulin suppressor-like RCC1 family protein
MTKTTQNSARAKAAYTANLVQPTYVNAQGVQFKNISCGRHHMAAVTSHGKVITWGNPDQGKLGHNLKTLSEEEA